MRMKEVCKQKAAIECFGFHVIEETLCQATQINIVLPHASELVQYHLHTAGL